MSKAESKFNPLKVVLQSHRVTYVHIKEPSRFEDDGPAKYDTTFLIPYGHPDIDKIQAAIKAAYDANKESMFKGLPLTAAKMWNPLRDGAEWLEEHPEALEYQDHYFIKAASKSQPALFDEDGQDIIDIDEKIYSGAYCRGVMVCFPFNNKSKGMGFYLNSLKFIDHGERLGGFAASHDDYDEEQAPATTNRPAARSAAPARPAPARPAPKAVEPMYDFAEDGQAIISLDGGNSWEYDV